MDAAVKFFTGFLQTLKEAFKIFHTNKTLISTVALSTAGIYSFLLITNFLSLRPLVADLATKQALLLTVSPSTTDFISLVFSIQKDYGLFFGAQWIFIFLFSLSSVFFSTITILASTETLTGQNPSFKTLTLAAARIWKRPLSTFFYISVFSLGFIFLLLMTLIPFLLIQRAFSFPAITTTIAAFLFCAYLSVTWTLGIVVSVMEDKYGLEALGEAARLVKGVELQGFCLSVFVSLLSYAVMYVSRLHVIVKRSYVTELVVGIVVVNGMMLVRMYVLMAFTVLYRRSKENKGEEVESTVSYEYTKIPSLPLMGQNLP